MIIQKKILYIEISLSVKTVNTNVMIGAQTHQIFYNLMEMTLEWIQLIPIVK